MEGNKNQTCNYRKLQVTLEAGLCRIRLRESSDAAEMDSAHLKASWEQDIPHGRLHAAHADNSTEAIDQLQAELWHADSGLHSYDMPAAQAR